MTQELYLLPEDKEWAKRRVAELENEIQQLGPEFNDVFTQSSETWHDNAPFEAVRDRQSILAAELHKLRTIIRCGTAKKPKAKQNFISIGDRVHFDNASVVHIAGDWTYRAGQCIDGVTFISSSTPLARQLLNKKVGDKITINNKTLTILKKETV